MNEYQQKYEELIYFRQFVEILTDKTNTELHHIKMKSLYPELAKVQSNLVRLKTLEHVLAHKYLMLWYELEYGKESHQYFAAFDAYNIMIITRDGITISDEEAAQLRSENGKRMQQKSKKLWKNPEYRQKKSKCLSDLNNIWWQDPEYRQKKSDLMSISISTYYANPANRELQSKLSKERVTGTVLIYNEKTKQRKQLKGEQLQLCLKNGWTLGTPIYFVPTRGKNKGQLITKYICPWTISDSCYLRGNWSLIKPNI